MYTPVTTDLICHLERFGHGPLLQVLQEVECYKRNGKVNLSAVGRKLGMSPTAASKWYAELVADARHELNA